MHSQSEDGHQALFPISSIHDVARVFFNPEDSLIWDEILISHHLYSP